MRLTSLRLNSYFHPAWNVKIKHDNVNYSRGQKFYICHKWYVDLNNLKCFQEVHFPPATSYSALFFKHRALAVVSWKYIVALSNRFYYFGLKKKYPQILVQFHLMFFFKTGIAKKLPNKIELKLKHMILYSKFVLLLSNYDHGYNGGIGFLEARKWECPWDQC